MTPLHTNIRCLLGMVNAPKVMSDYEAFSAALCAIRDLVNDRPNRQCLNCGSTTGLLHVADSPLSVCGDCLGIPRNVSL